MLRSWPQHIARDYTAKKGFHSQRNTANWLQPSGEPKLNLNLNDSGGQICRARYRRQNA